VTIPASPEPVATALPHFGRGRMRRASLAAAAWIAIAVFVNIVAPPLQLIGRPEPFSSAATSLELEKSFPGTSTDNTGFVVLDSSRALGAPARDYLKALSAKLRSQTAQIQTVLNPASDPLTAPIAESNDRHSIFIQIWLRGRLGTTEGVRSFETLARTVHELSPPAGVNATVTGPAAVAVSKAGAVTRYSSLLLVAVVLVAALLTWVISRSGRVVAMTLLAAFLALATALPLLWVCASAFSCDVHAYTVPLSSAFAAGTALWATMALHRTRSPVLTPNRQSFRAAERMLLASSGVAAASLIAAATVNVLAVRAVALAAGTATAAASLAATMMFRAWPTTVRRPGWPNRGHHMWAFRLRVCRWVYRRPQLLAAALVLALAGSGLLLRSAAPSFVETATYSPNRAADRGYAVVAQHFTANRLAPQTVLISSRHDLRNPRGLLSIDRVTRQLMSLPGVRLVQSASWPGGAPSEQTSLAHQLGEMNRQLQADGLSTSSLNGAITQLPDALTDMTRQVDQLQAGINSGSAGLAPIKIDLDQLHASVLSVDKTANAVARYADPVRAWMSGIPDCSADVLCAQTLKVVQPMDTVLSDLAGLTAITQHLSETYDHTTQSVSAAAHTLETLRATLDKLKPTADEMAGLVRKVIPQATRMTAFVNALTDDLSSDGSGGFYMSQDSIELPAYRSVKNLMFSPDGKATRIQVYSDGAAFGADSARVAAALRPAVAAATKYGALADSIVTTFGAGSAINAAQSQWIRDWRLVTVASCSALLLFAALVLRSLATGAAVALSAFASSVIGAGFTVGLVGRVVGQQVSGTALLLVPVVVAALAGSEGLDLARRVQRRGMPAHCAPRDYAAGWMCVASVLLGSAVLAAFAGALPTGLGATGAVMLAVSLAVSSFLYRAQAIIAVALVNRRTVTETDSTRALQISRSGQRQPARPV
jgi:putative drug exporter of the RND superfamily